MSGIMQCLLSHSVSGAAAFVFSPTISTNTVNYNLRAAAVAAGWNQVDALTATVTINSGVVVYSSSTGTPAFDTGVTFPGGTTLTIVNNGTILGKGGKGGSTGQVPGQLGQSGFAGGPALKAQFALSITNNGRVAGGGGGGGSGGLSGGGGGGGIGNGSGGAATGPYLPDNWGQTPGGAGTLTSAGTAGTPGAYSYHSPEFNYDNAGGTSGDGGTYGTAGGGGGQGFVSDDTGTSYYNGGSGGVAGACSVGNANITWTVAGTRNGALT